MSKPNGAMWPGDPRRQDLEGEIRGEGSDKFNLRAHRCAFGKIIEAFDSTTTFVPVEVRAYRSIAS